MNKDKVIKDLRERNDKLKNQYEIMQIRNCALEQHTKSLEKRNKELENGFKAAMEELCEYAEENEKLKQSLESRLKYSDELDKKIATIDKAVEYIEKYKRFGMGEEWFETSTPVTFLLKTLRGEDNGI